MSSVYDPESGSTQHTSQTQIEDENGIFEIIDQFREHQKLESHHSVNMNRVCDSHHRQVIAWRCGHSFGGTEYLDPEYCQFKIVTPYDFEIEKLIPSARILNRFRKFFEELESSTPTSEIFNLFAVKQIYES